MSVCLCVHLRLLLPFPLPFACSSFCRVVVRLSVRGLFAESASVGNNTHSYIRYHSFALVRT